MKAERMVDPDISDPEKDYISILVYDTFPANKKGVIIKSQKDIVQYNFKVKKFDELKGELHFCTYAAAELDTDNQFMKSQDIDHMHDGLMKNLKHTRLADINHDQKRLNDVWINEIWKERDAEGNTISSNGVYIIKENAYLMQKAKEGKINGVSIMGRVKDIVVEEVTKSDSMLDMVKSIYNKLFKNEDKEVAMAKEELQTKTDEEIVETETPEEPKVEPTEPETPEEPETSEIEQLKSENETLKADLTEKELLLTKAQEKIDALTKEKSILEKARTTKPVDGAKTKSETKITKAQWQKMDAFDKHNFAVEFPDIASQYENSL